MDTKTIICKTSKYALPVTSSLWILQKLAGKRPNGQPKIKGPWGWLTLLSIPMSVIGGVGCAVASLPWQKNGSSRVDELRVPAPNGRENRVDPVAPGFDVGPDRKAIEVAAVAPEEKTERDQYLAVVNYINPRLGIIGALVKNKAYFVKYLADATKTAKEMLAEANANGGSMTKKVGFIRKKDKVFTSTTIQEALDKANQWSSRMANES